MPKRVLKKEHHFHHSRFPFSRIRARLKRMQKNHQQLVQSMLKKRKEQNKKDTPITSFNGSQVNKMSYTSNASTSQESDNVQTSASVNWKNFTFFKETSTQEFEKNDEIVLVPQLHYTKDQTNENAVAINKKPVVEANQPKNNQKEAVLTEDSGDEIQFIEEVKVTNSLPPPNQESRQLKLTTKSTEVQKLTHEVKALTPNVKKNKKTFFPTPKISSKTVLSVDPIASELQNQKSHSLHQNISFLDRLQKNNNSAASKNLTNSKLQNKSDKVSSTSSPQRSFLHRLQKNNDRPFFKKPPQQVPVPVPDQASTSSIQVLPSTFDPKVPPPVPTMSNPDLMGNVSFFKNPLCAQFNPPILGTAQVQMSTLSLSAQAQMPLPNIPSQVQQKVRQPPAIRQKTVKSTKNSMQGNSGIQNKSKTSSSQQPRPSLMSIRQFLPLPHKFSAHESIDGLTGFRLKVCSYNVLCEATKLNHPYLYREPQQQVKWETRKRLLIDELSALNAEVFCLQEVQYEHFVDTFEPFFNKQGFKCYYTKRTGLDKLDGCMLAFRSEMFTELGFDHVYYNYDVEGFDKDNVGQIVLLQEKKTNLIFLVANTHILFNMKRGDLKAGQIALLLATVDKHVQTFSLYDNFAGSILCGDFNIEPLSPLYYFICGGALQISQFPRDILAFSQHSGKYGQQPLRSFIVPNKVSLDPNTCQLLDEDREEKIDYTVSALFHKHHLLSAYRHATTEFELEVSTRHTDYGCPDFIFYSGHQHPQLGKTSEKRIRIQKILILPSLQTIDNTCGKMPNKECGSDHIPLICEFFIH